MVSNTFSFELVKCLFLHKAEIDYNCEPRILAIKAAAAQPPWMDYCSLSILPTLIKVDDIRLSSVAVLLKKKRN